MSIIAKETIVSHLESVEEFPIVLSDVWEWLGYSRKDSAVKGFDLLELIEGEDFEVFRLKLENLKGGRPAQEVRMTIDSFKGWAMSAQTSKGKEVRRYYLKIEKEWKAQKAATPQVSAEQVEAFVFQKDIFAPWVDDHPKAAIVFRAWQGLISPALPTAPDALNPSIEAQKALNGAFLNLNRSGLMMNKLFHFLDRIPTMKTLDDDFVNQLVEGLSESERVRESLLGDLKKASARSSKLEKENTRLKAEIKELNGKTERNQRAKSSQSQTTVWTGSIPLQLKSAN